MISQLGKAGKGTPHFCYHVGDVVYYTGAHDDYILRALGALHSSHICHSR
jgi:hypothetical protein